MAKVEKAQQALRAVKKRKRTALVKDTPQIAGRFVFFEAVCEKDFTARKLAGLGVVRCDSRPDAGLFIVAVLEKSSSRTQFAARLLGATIATPQYLMSSGNQGAALSFHPAIAIKRMIVISHRFMELYQCVCADLFDILQFEDCQWTLLPSVAAAVQHLNKGPAGLARQKRQRASTNCIGYLSKN